MDFLLEALTNWLKEMLVGGIMSNLSGMFDSVNQQVADISVQVGQTPQGWNGSIFSMIENLSNTIIVPIAGIILAIVMTVELIQMIVDKNNLHDVDTWMIFKWVFKSAAAILIVTNTWNIVMAVFDMAQSVVAQSAGIISSDASIDISTVLTEMEPRLMEMDLGPLFGLWFQSLFIGITMWALYICIFEGWCDFLNYFDSSIHFQLSFLNLAASEETFASSISIPPQGDDFDSIRAEYTTMLQNQLARGNNGLIKTKYLTFGIDADSIRAAKPRLERIETDILNNFKRLGVAAEVLDGKARLAQLHAIFHMDEQAPFQFEWDWLAPSGLSTKDFIAPSSFEFRTGKQFRMGKKYGTVSFLQILAPELNDRLLADFLDMESSLIVSLHIQSVDQVKAIKTVKRKITDLDRSKIEEQKKAVRAGYDMDIIPSDLATYGSEAKKLLQDLQSRKGDCFAIYQVCRDDPQNVRFMNLDWLQSHDISVDRSNYDLIYTAPLDGSVSADAQLEKIYEQFNLEKPVDFHSPSLSVSDIVAVKRDGMVSCHYCDSVGFAEIPGFLPNNPLKNAEMSMEDDYGMIDGIINNGAKEPTVAQLEQQARSGQPISLMDLAAAAHREEQDKRKSVVEQLHQQPKQENKKTAPKKSAEREI